MARQSSQKPKTRKSSKPNKTWTTRELAFMRENCNNLTNCQLANTLGTRVSQVTMAMANNGIKRDPEVVSQMRADALIQRISSGTLRPVKSKKAARRSKK